MGTNVVISTISQYTRVYEHGTPWCFCITQNRGRSVGSESLVDGKKKRSAATKAPATLEAEQGEIELGSSAQEHAAALKIQTIQR